MIIENVNLIDANNNFLGNVRITGGYIEGINVDIGHNEEVINGNGYTLMPSFVDMHCHLREPGYEYKEDIKTGMMAALKGGYTHLVAMANTQPIIDNLGILEENIAKEKLLDLCDLTQVCAVTKGFGKETVDVQELSKVTKVFSNDGVTITDREVMKKALLNSNKYNVLIATHCEPEFEIIKRDLELLEYYQGNIHICHISQKKSLEIIKKYKELGFKFTCEITPHHLYDEEIDYKVNPPFGTKEDRQALISGIKDGFIDICGTDHAPHSELDKTNGAPGISNIEVAFQMVWSVFYNEEISIQKLSHMMSLMPCELLGLNSGEISIGKEANLVLVDLDYSGKIDTKEFISKSNNNPFNNRDIRGKVLMTIKRGEIKYDNR